MNNILTYFSGKKNEPNRVTVVGKVCDNDTLCLGFARQSNKDNFSGKLGVTIATGRIEKQKHCLNININGDVKEQFINEAQKLAELITPDMNWKKLLITNN